MAADGQMDVSPPSVDFGDDADERPSAAEGPAPADSSHVAPVAPQAKLPEGPMRPRRVEAALKSPKSFEEYRRNRPFKFLHMYSGPRDPRHEVTQLEATRTRSLDKMKDPKLDLSDHNGFKIMKEDVSRGEWDYAHAGFPCGNFSMARHHKVPGQPGPFLDKAHIYGLTARANKPKLTEALAWPRRRQRSMRPRLTAASPAKFHLLDRLRTRQAVKNLGALGMHGKWRQVCRELLHGKKIKYNTCAYQLKEKQMFLKPGIWAH